MSWYRELLKSDHAKQLLHKELGWIEEIRMSVDKPLCIRNDRRAELLWPKTTQRDLEEILNAACRQSLYAHTETLKRGYITIEGGHRIGVCGCGVMQDGQVRSIRGITSLVIRIAKQVIGCADLIAENLKSSTLILGPPGSGKTTLLRDLVRQLSDKSGYRVSLADERGEIAAALSGVAQFELGRNTDILTNIPKPMAAMMLLRNANPHWIAMDEITQPDDVKAMEEISYCGVNLLATAHAEDVGDLQKRPLYKDLMKRRIFRTLVLLRRDKSYIVQEVME